MNKLNNSRYLQSYSKELNQDSNRFHVRKGEFTTFIEKNNHYKSIGPLLGKEREVTRIE